jgi:hypothetical protein
MEMLSSRTESGAGAPGAEGEAVRLLREHLESRSAVEALGPRTLSPGVAVLIWALRVYVLCMAAAVAVNVAATVR